MRSSPCSHYLSAERHFYRCKGAWPAEKNSARRWFSPSESERFPPRPPLSDKPTPQPHLSPKPVGLPKLPASLRPKTGKKTVIRDSPAGATYGAPARPCGGKFRWENYRDIAKVYAKHAGAPARLGRSADISQGFLHDVSPRISEAGKIKRRCSSKPSMISTGVFRPDGFWPTTGSSALFGRPGGTLLTTRIIRNRSITTGAGPTLSQLRNPRIGITMGTDRSGSPEAARPCCTCGGRARSW